MKTVKVKVYEYAELNDEAKEKALDWFLNACANDAMWWEDTKEDAKTVYIKLVGVDVGRGCSIEGSLTQSPSAVAQKIVSEHGPKCETHKTAKAFLDWEAKHGHESDHDDDETTQWFDERENMEETFEHDILEDYLSMARRNFEYEQSKEYLEEGIEANGYTFTEDGKRKG